VDFRDRGTDGNQTNVAIELNGLVATATGRLADVVNNVYDLNLRDALNAMTSMSGIIYQHVARSGLDTGRAFINTNLQRLELVAGRRSRHDSAALKIAALQSVAADPTGDPDYGFWFNGFGGVANYSGDLADPGSRSPSHGFLVGFDAPIGRALTLGVSGGSASPDVTLDDAFDHSSTRMGQFGVYGRYAMKSSRLDAAFGGSSYDNHTFRAVTDGVDQFRFSSDAGAITLSGQVEYGRLFTVGPKWFVEPEGALQIGHSNLDGFDEQGEGVLALGMPNRTERSTRSVGGSKAGRTFAFGGANMMLAGRAAWVHEFRQIDDVAVRFLGDPSGQTFTLRLRNQLTNGAQLGGSFTGDTRGRLRFFVDFGAEVGGPLSAWSGNFGVNKSW